MGRNFQLTIDEWFFHWFADEEKYKLASKFFIKVLDICDKIVLKKNTPLARKFYQLDKESGKWLPDQRKIVRVIKNLYLSNSDKIYWVDEAELFTEDVNRNLPRKDIYLVEICSQTINKIFVTSDNTLYNNLLELQPTLLITPYLVEDFIEKYLSDKI